MPDRKKRESRLATHSGLPKGRRVQPGKKRTLEVVSVPVKAEEVDVGRPGGCSPGLSFNAAQPFLKKRRAVCPTSRGFNPFCF